MIFYDEMAGLLDRLHSSARSSFFFLAIAVFAAPAPAGAASDHASSRENREAPRLIESGSAGESRLLTPALLDDAEAPREETLEAAYAPSATILDEETLPNAGIRQSPTNELPPSASSFFGRLLSEGGRRLLNHLLPPPDALSDEKLARLFEAAAPASKAVTVLGGQEKFRSHATGLVERHLDLGSAGLGRQLERNPSKDPRVRAQAEANRDLLSVIEASASRPEARSFLAALAQRRARDRSASENVAAPKNALPENPLGSGPYWVLSFGSDLMNGRIGRDWLDAARGSELTFFHISHYVVAYLNALIAPAGDNAQAVQASARMLPRPERDLSVLRILEPPQFFKDKVSEMSAWIAPGGRLVLQADTARRPSGETSPSIGKTYGSLLIRLIESGWNVSRQRSAPGVGESWIAARPETAAAAIPLRDAQRIWESLRSDAPRMASTKQSREADSARVPAPDESGSKPWPERRSASGPPQASARAQATAGTVQAKWSVQYTGRFKDDTKAFVPQDWQRIQAALETLTKLLSTGQRLLGGYGNIKVLTGGPLAGLTEFKVNGRYDRVYLRVDPIEAKQRRIIFVRYLDRNKVTQNGVVRRDLSDWKGFALADGSFMPFGTDLSVNLPAVSSKD